MLTEARSNMAVKPDIAVTINGTDEAKVQLLSTPVDYMPLPPRSPGGSNSVIYSQGQSWIQCNAAF